MDLPIYSRDYFKLLNPDVTNFLLPQRDVHTDRFSNLVIQRIRASTWVITSLSTARWLTKFYPTCTGRGSWTHLMGYFSR